ncbi:MAG: penicillin-binding transpeptidase domain-containing protein [Candidatus Kaiserbacteria bacterium]|nr:penicillin-binding transpeptidase domain-containing protein [Candidatus Kaiserbacteria bacterium]
MWRRTRRQDPEIAPDEIFLDSSNAPEFDRLRFEGRLEKPLPASVFRALGGTLAFLMLVLVIRTWNLQVLNGASFASDSAHNSLEVRTLFAPRGVIIDSKGVVVAENVEKEDGSMKRNYPVPSLGHIIGYVSYPKKDAKGVYYETKQTGLAGLEAKYDALLEGKNGQLLTETDVSGKIRSEGTVVRAETGKTMQLSIDANLQKLFERAIANIAHDKHFIAGAGVIMDVQTGAVRAIVSYPSYDPNVMASGGPSSVIAAYNTNPGRPFIDHAVQGVYVPGSIVKPLVASGALSDGIITPNTVIDDPGFLSLPDPYHPGKTFIYKGWRALGAVDVRKAIAWSSDVFFYTISGGFGTQKGLGIDRLEYWYRQYGLGSPTGINVPGEASGLIPDPAWKKKTFNESWYLGDTYFTAIGQYSVQVTPLQMARATAAIANGGKLFTPTLLADQVPTSVPVLVDSGALKVVREGMRQAVTSALAGAINVPYVSAAAKTGTAQTGVRNQYDNSWVVGFFPYENPQYAFTVVLERGPEGTGEQAVNVMRDLFESLHAENSPYVGGTGVLVESVPGG